MLLNPLNCIDFYKADHRRQYPEGTTRVYSNFTPRSDKLANMLPDFDNKVVFFGLQYFIVWFLVEVWNEQFFDLEKEHVVSRYKRRLDNSLGKDAVPVEHIEALHDLGYLPIEIKALAEGTRVPVKVPVLTITNTKPEFFWLVNYLESVMSCMLWQTCTSATIAYEYKRLLTKWALKTGAPLDFVQFQAHDFSLRGMGGIQSAMMSGAAHMTSFVGTDSVPAIDLLESYYNANSDEELVGTSVAATEHSVQSLGTKAGELDTFKRLITQVYPSGIVSIVSDTWDFWKVVTEYVTELKPDILAREGKLVIRPDSGDPVEILCGVDIEVIEADTMDEAEEFALEILSEIVADKTAHGEHGANEAERLFRFNDTVYKASISVDWNRYDKQFYYMDGVSLTGFEPIKLTPAQRGAVECLWDVFGGTTTETGHKILDSHIGLIYGDSITLERASKILERLEKKGFASHNVVFGVGSFTYQYNTRDTFGFAVKSTYGEVNGEPRVIFKDPITDNGTKRSARGLLRVDENLVLHDEQTWEEEKTGLLKTVYKDGRAEWKEKLSDIRARLA